ncbi:hypothetical protein [Streptomyces cinereoruber]
MRQEHVWAEVLDEAGFAGIRVEELPAGEGPRAAVVFLISAGRSDAPA